MPNVGVLALQGAFIEHIKILKIMGVEAFQVRNLQDLELADSLIIPGGESTVIGMQLKLSKMTDEIRKKIKQGMPMWGTCAGLILLSDNVDNQKTDSQEILGGIPIKTVRNHYGRQSESFVGDIVLKNGENQSTIFIRAPFIKKTGPKVNVLANYNDSPVAVSYNNLLGTCFHPELSDTNYWHELFIKMIK